jgi:hypothetical protein
MYDKVIAVDFYGKYDDVLIGTECDFIDHIGARNNACEIIGGENQLIKPIFDFDSYEEIDIPLMTNKINKIFPNKIVNYATREPRLKDGKMRYSARAYVDGVMISYGNLAYLVKNSDFKEADTSIYSKNRKMFLPLTTRKEWDNIVPVLKPINDATYFQCCASYIRKTFENWDNIVEEMKGKKLLETIEKHYDKKDEIVNNSDDVIDTAYIQKKLLLYITKMHPDRATSYDSWSKMIWCLCNICNKEGISNRICGNIIHEFSKKAINYNENATDDFIDKCDNLREASYGWNYLYQCIKIDDYDFYITITTMTYNKVKEDFDKRIFKCNDPIGFVELNINQNELNPVPYYIRTRAEITQKYEDLLYYDKDKNGKGVKNPFTTKWFKDPTKISYHNVVFIPKKLSPELAKNHFNLFKGYRAENLPVCKNYELIEPVKSHLFNIISKGREEVYNYLLQWLAQLIQNPCVKTQVFIILKSEPGSGKNIILDMISKKIIGEYAVDTAAPERVFFGNFNSLLSNKVLVVCNEAGNGMRSCIDRIKDVVTSPTINIEKKGIDPIVFDNYANVIATTNNRAPIPISPEDRRLVLLDVSMAKKGDEEYFNKLLEIYNNDLAISALYHYLLEEVKITIKNFQKERPITEEYKKTQSLFIPNYMLFIISIADTLEWKNYNKKEICLLRSKELYHKYKLYCDECKITPSSKKNFIFDIVCDRSSIAKCTSKGYECVRLYKPEFENWIGEYKSLETEMDLENYDDYEFPISYLDDE